MQIYPWEQNMHVLACDLLSLATFYGWLAARFLAGLQHLTHDGIAAGGVVAMEKLALHKGLNFNIFIHDEALKVQIVPYNVEVCW